MKTKKRNINSETTTANIYKKKINTRNMNNKHSNEIVTCLSSVNNNNSNNNNNNSSINNNNGNNNNNTNGTASNKPSPNTRAKSNCMLKSHSDPYAFTKTDEDKIPIKRIKVTEKMGKEVGVNTSSLSTMIEPEYLGPCEPGTSIELQGIVWLETTTGLLVINVTWRGRTYVGTLMDSTKYEFTPSFSQENLGKFESRPQNRSTRGKKRQVGNPVNDFSLRSNNIRHSSRLNESINSPNAEGTTIKKLSTRQTNNLINYFDSTNQSATASGSGDSDTDKNSYSKFSTNSKTRSVTRSITKLNKAALCESSSAEDNNNTMVKCTKTNCFKRFVDITAYQYHVQRCHDLYGKIDNSPNKPGDPINCLDQTDKKNCIKIEPTDREKEKTNSCNEYNSDNSVFKTSNCKINGVINKGANNKIDNFEFNSDSETEKNTNLSYSYCEKEKDMKTAGHDNFGDHKHFIKSENISTQFQELSVSLPKVSDSSISNSETLKSSLSSASIEMYSCKFVDSNANLPIESQVVFNNNNSNNNNNKSVSTPVKNTMHLVSEPTSTTATNTHSSASIRTVTAPTVSIPVELVSTPNNLSNSSISSPALIRPKPNHNQITSLIHSSQNRKFKTSKSFSQSNGILEPFQIPSSSPVILKKRPLVPLKVAVNQNSSMNINRMYPISSSNNVTSPNQSSRHIRSSSISPVTPILPAMSTVNSTSSTITTTSSTSGSSVNTSLSTIFHNGQLAVRRPSINSNITTGPTLSTLVSLKPIQPKPKTSQFTVPITTGLPGVNTPVYTVSQSIIAPSMSGISNVHVSHQRQILPSPISKSDCNVNVDESLIHKIESLKTSSLKRKRRKPEKKIRINFHETNRYKKFALNPIQPKHITNEHFTSKINCNEDFCLTNNDKYKTDEENSHSPGYSDLSETNDTPAPILEKEIDLKTGECDKLVICTDFDSMSAYRHNSSSSDNYDDPKDLSNKPPALMPAVLSSDLVNGTTNELDYRDVKPRVSRKKSLTSKKSHKLKDVTKGKLNVDKSLGSEWVNISSSRSNSLTMPNRKSFQSSSVTKPTLSSAPLLSSSSSFSSSSKSSVKSLPVRDYCITDQNTKFISLNRSSITSAINDFVQTNNTVEREKEKNFSNNKSVDSSFQSILNFNEDSGKTRNKSTTPSPNNSNGKFSVQGTPTLTSPQEVVSRSIAFATSATVSSIIPNTKLSNALFKN